MITFDKSTNPIRADKDTSITVIEEQDAPIIQRLVEKAIRKVISSTEYEVIILDNVTALQNLVLENIDGASRDGRQTIKNCNYGSGS